MRHIIETVDIIRIHVGRHGSDIGDRTSATLFNTIAERSAIYGLATRFVDVGQKAAIIYENRQ